MLKEPKIRSEKHRRFISGLPCCVCSLEGQTQAAHIRHENGGGMGLKPSDEFCVPLCVSCHAEQHHFSEKKYWGINIDTAKQLAKNLHTSSGDEAEARFLITRFQGEA